MFLFIFDESMLQKYLMEQQFVHIVFVQAECLLRLACLHLFDCTSAHAACSPNLGVDLVPPSFPIRTAKVE